MRQRPPWGRPTDAKKLGAVIAHDATRVLACRLAEQEGHSPIQSLCRADLLIRCGPEDENTHNLRELAIECAELLHLGDE